MKVIGLDVGEKRIGVAQADSATRIAVPVGFILADGTEWEKLRQFSARFNTSLFVVGLPRSNDGNETAQSQYARGFAQRLVAEIPGAKVQFQDESLTSIVAEERLKARKKNYDKGEIDAEASSIILQDFLEGLNVANASSSNTLRSQDASQLSPRTHSKPFGQAYGPREEFGLHSETQSIQTKENHGKKKSKKGMTTALIALIVLVILGLLGFGGWSLYNYIKEKRAEERRAEYARQEAEMIASTFNFTIRPGETLRDIRKQLLEVNRNGESDPETPLANYTEAEVDKALNASYDYDFLTKRPEGASLEGYLYPETYNFYGTSTVEDIIKRFLDGMEKAISENNLETKYAERGLTLHQGIILASIVQKEAKAGDMATVAQVFLTRLSYGMALGSDVTVSYAVDLVDPDRTTYDNNQDALRIDSCYNTRIYAGLPCGAISTPGITALTAVAEPTDTDYLYFLTGDDGLMYYGHTEAEHNQNIYYHCKELCNVLL